MSSEKRAYYRNSFNKFLLNLDKYSPLIQKKDRVPLLIEKPPRKIYINNYAKIHNSETFTIEKINSILLSEESKNININYSIFLQDKIKNITHNFSPLQNKYIYYRNISANFLSHSNKNRIINTNYFSKNIFGKKSQNFLSSEIFNNVSPNNNMSSGNEIKRKILSMNNKIIINENNSASLLIKNELYQRDITNYNINNSIKPREEDDGSTLKMKTPLYRQDYYVKQFKVKYSYWLRNLLNRKVKILLKGKRDQIKFHPLNSLKFTANPKYEDNKIFLSLTVKEILVFGIEHEKSSNQRKNKESIIAIENKYSYYNKEQGDEILCLLNSSMEESVKLFYESEEFKEFKNNKTTQEYDEKLIQEKGFSLLKPFGFIDLFKNFKGNCKTQVKFYDG